MDDLEDLTCLNYITEIQFACDPKDPIPILDKLLQLQAQEMTKSYLFRQLLLLDEFLASYKTAFYICDLPLIMQLLEQLCGGLSSVPQYYIPLKLLFEKAEQLPLLRCSSEKAKCFQVLPQYFDLWAHILLTCACGDLLGHVGKILFSLLTTAPDKNTITRDMLRSAMEQSYLPSIVALLLPDADEVFYQLLLKVSIELALMSPAICDKMMKEGAVNSVLLRLDPEHATRVALADYPVGFTISNLDDTTRLIWFLFDGVQELPKDLYPQITQDAWRSFRFAITTLIRNQSAKLERNFLIGCILKGFSTFPNFNMYACRLPDDFCDYCVKMAIESGDTWSSNVRHSKEILDYKFKKMMLLMVSFLAKTGLTEPIRRRKVLQTLLKLISPEENSRWSSFQYCTLLQLALYVAILITPLLMDDFVSYDGPRKLLTSILYYEQCSYEPEILVNCLRLLWTAVQAEDEAALAQFKEHDIIQTLINVSDLLLKSPNFAQIKQDCVTYVFCISETFVQKYPGPQEAMVRLGLDFLKRTLRAEPDDGFLDSKVTISCISCLWECVKSREENLKRFVTNKGVYVLLDTIESGIPIVQVIGLGMLVDLCEDESSIPYVMTWRKRGKRYMTVLLDIVRRENEKLQVKRTKSGAIKDIYQPIMGKLQYELTYSHDKPLDSSPAIMDLYGSSRPKVYAIVQLIRRHSNVVDIVNERYKIQVYVESIADQLTMLVIENFLTLKLGEVWTEVANDLKSLGLQLMGADDNLITTLSMRLPNMAQYIQNSQIAILQEVHRKETTHEQDIYLELKEARLGSSLAALNEIHYIARTTESIFRMIHKMRQRTYVDNANLPYSNKAEHHNTFQYSINVNPVFHQHVTIKSDMDQKIMQTIKEISPGNSTDSLDTFSDDLESVASSSKFK